jgi:hypothetical protein
MFVKQENALLFFTTPFVKWLQSLLRCKNTPLLFKELNVINCLLYTPLLVKGEVLNIHKK